MIHDPLFDDPAAREALLAPIPPAEIEWKTRRLTHYHSSRPLRASLPHLTPPQTTHLLRQYHFATYIKDTATADRARNLLIVSHTHLAVAAAAHCSRLCVSFDDAVSLGYFSFYRTIDIFDFRRPSSFASFIFYGAVFAISNQHRRRCRESRRFLPQGSEDGEIAETADNLVETQELQHFVQDRIRGLTPAEQKLIWQRWWGQSTVEDQAQEEGCSLRTAYRRRTAAMENLERALEQKYAEYV